MDGKQGQWQLDSSRVRLPVFLLLIGWDVFVTLSSPGRVIRVYSARTHSTILVYVSTPLCKFVCVWKNAKNPRTHQLAVHNQRFRTTWKPFILTKNLGVPKDLWTASMRISMRGLHLCVLVMNDHRFFA